MDDTDELTEELDALRAEHRKLDDEILSLTAHVPFDQLKVKRMKVRKLALKDRIARLESELVPDIIA